MKIAELKELEVQVLNAVGTLNTQLHRAAATGIYIELKIHEQRELGRTVPFPRLQAILMVVPSSIDYSEGD